MIFLDDRRVISASPFNLSRGLARPFADLIKKIVKGRRARNHSISALPKLEEVFADYIEKERLPPENTIKDKLFIVFAESEEEVCTVKKLKEIERNSPSEDGRRERISISVNPVSPRSYQDHRCERSGIYKTTTHEYENTSKIHLYCVSFQGITFQLKSRL